LNYHWPPNSWRRLTIPQLVRIYAVEKKLAEERRPQVSQPTAPPMDMGSEADDDDE